MATGKLENALFFSCAVVLLCLRNCVGGGNMKEKEKNQAPGRKLRLIKTAKSMSLFVTLILTCMTVTLAVTQDESDKTSKVKCNTQQLEIPDLGTLHLPDGEHVIAQADTPHGKLEVRVTMKKSIVDGPAYYIGGKRLTKTPAARIPEPLQDCLAEGLRCGIRQAEAESSNSWLSTAIQGIVDWIVPSAEARYNRPRCYIMSSGCYEGWGCCAAACCSFRGEIGCHSHCEH
jgi:hypothetical protein